MPAKGGGMAMMMRGGKGEGGAGEGEWGGEVVEVAAAEVARRRYRQRRAVGDGEVKVLHRRPRNEAGAGRWFQTSVVRSVSAFRRASERPFMNSFFFSW